MTTETTRKYEIINHGAENQQYFQGQGTAFTEFDAVATGTGDNEVEAYNDAVENIFMVYDKAEALHLPTRPRGLNKKNKLTSQQAESGEVYWYVSILYKTEGRTYIGMREKNIYILQDRIIAFNAHPGPRVGDYVYLPADDTHAEYYTRITHDWGDQVQTGGHEHSQFYFHASGTLDYSGGLDSGVATADLIATEEKKNGSAWFFDGNIRGAGGAWTSRFPCGFFA